MGGCDQQRIYGVIMRLRNRLNPENPSAIIKDADAVLKQYVLSGSEAPYWVDPAIVQSLRETLD